MRLGKGTDLICEWRGVAIAILQVHGNKSGHHPIGQFYLRVSAEFTCQGIVLKSENKKLESKPSASQSLELVVKD